MAGLDATEALIAVGSTVVTSLFGYLGVAGNALRRLREGTLQSVRASLPGFEVRWRKDDQRYEVRTFLGRLTFGGPEPERSEYAARIEQLTTQARSAARELDLALKEMADAVNERRDSIQELEAQLEALRRSEAEQKDRIDRLSAVEPAAAKEFIALLDSDMSKRERSSARRDLRLFVLGVLSTVIVSAIFYALS